MNDENSGVGAAAPESLAAPVASPPDATLGSYPATAALASPASLLDTEGEGGWGHGTVASVMQKDSGGWGHIEIRESPRTPEREPSKVARDEESR
jgi:hypothetical protein